ncbi:MAG: DUF1002 domain-containing protein [Candidatus Spyradocola sp.]
MKMLKKALCLLLCCATLLLPVAAQAAEVGQSITCYGDDLTSEQFQQVIELLDADLANDTLVTVYIEDEKNLLGGIVSADKIGSRSISSARVTLTGEGTGISVTTHNINWVTPSMYSSALITAGVQNAKIVVAAPVEVSGTAALAGILKAYEQGINDNLSSLAKAVAGNEIVLTGDLADVIGSEQAVELLAMVKQAIADYNLDDYDTLRPYVVQGAQQLGVQLTDAQIDQITKLGVEFAKLDLDPEQLASQLNGLIDNIQKIQVAQQTATTIFTQIKDAVQGFFNWIGSWFKR